MKKKGKAGSAAGTGRGIASNTSYVGKMPPVPQVLPLGSGVRMSNPAPHTMGVGKAAGMGNVSKSVATKQSRKGGKAY